MNESENKDEKFEPQAPQLDALFARDNAKALTEREARERAAAWPGEVEQLLVTLLKRSNTQAEALGAIHDRLAVIEGAMGIGKA